MSFIPTSRITIKQLLFEILSVFLGLILIFFFAVPLLKLILSTEPHVIYSTIKDKEVLNSLKITFEAGIIATLISLVMGVPLSYILARKKFPGKSFISALIDIPVVMPHTAAGVALLFVFGKNFFMGKLFAPLGIKFVGELPGIVIAMMFVSAPFLINQVREGFASVDPYLEKVARTLGANSWQTFWKVSFPLVKRHMASGMLMMWARGISEFGAVVILAYHPMTAPVLIYERFESYGLDYAKPVSALLVLITLFLFLTIRFLLWRREPYDHQN